MKNIISRLLMICIAVSLSCVFCYAKPSNYKDSFWANPLDDIITDNGSVMNPIESISQGFMCYYDVFGGYHYGQDFWKNYDEGDPVYAMADGEIILIRKTSGYGGGSPCDNNYNTMIVEYKYIAGDGNILSVYVFYGHIKNIKGSNDLTGKEVQINTPVLKYEKIAELNNPTCHDMVPHLHLSVMPEKLMDDFYDGYSNEKELNGRVRPFSSHKDCYTGQAFFDTFSPAPGLNLDKLATAIILDRSGSMAEYTLDPSGNVLNKKNNIIKLEKAKEAAKSFILSRIGGDLVSIVTFSDAGKQVQDNANIKDVKKNIDLILDRIIASGSTNIGAGLERGFEQLINSGDTYQKMAILLSDGMNNRGEWETKVAKFKQQGWPICTVGFGSDADEKTLEDIALETGCTYEFAEISNVVNKYQSLSAYASGESTLLLASDALPPGGSLAYPFYVTAGAEKVNIYTSWQGSTLNTVLIAPDGTRFDKQVIVQGKGRSEEGSTFQMLELMNPMQGKWGIESVWSDPPQEAEQVNILVTEKTDSFVRIHGFRPQYAIGEPVTIRIDAQEQVSTGRKLPLIDPRISVEVKKPGAEMIRMVQAQSSNWTVYKDVMQDITRDIALSDDGMHDDYRENDGIYAGTFTETDKNGPYIVSATVRGKTQSGAFVEKTSTGVFQVGSIAENQVTIGQTLHYMDEAQRHLGKFMPPPEKKSPDPSGGTHQEDPLQSIDALQKDDPLQSIQDLMGR